MTDAMRWGVDRDTARAWWRENMTQAENEYVPIWKPPPPPLFAWPAWITARREGRRVAKLIRERREAQRRAWTEPQPRHA